ncbi:helix-turn-helix domain-containing protein [Mesorhizobium marinum]|uniref:Helix-turn-helix domain-containing protein n=1 Tax=Mesorhizobium marinum TaxID=3228790 RepID=A0ABV3R2B8_9HYPH
MSGLTPAGSSLPIDLWLLLEGVRKKISASNIQELSDTTGVTRPTLYDIAAGRRVPTIETFQRLLNHFQFAADAATHKHVLPPVVRGEQSVTPRAATTGTKSTA